MNEIEAKGIFEKQLLENLDGFSLVAESTQEFTGCFVFFYQNNEYIQSCGLADMSIGNGPVIVCKRTGNIFEAGTAYSSEHYVAAFEACGDPFGELTPKISVYGLEKGANKVAATKLIKAESCLGLRDSKLIIDNALENEASQFSTESVENSQKTVVQLQEYGFKCKQLWSKQC